MRWKALLALSFIGVGTLTCVLPLPVRAQTSPIPAGSPVPAAPPVSAASPLRLWGFAGAGTTDFGGLAAGYGVNLGVGVWHVGIRRSMNEGRLSTYRNTFLVSVPLRDEMYEAGLLVGRGFPVSSSGQILVSAGLGRVRVRRVVECTSFCLFGTGSMEEAPTRTGLMLELMLVGDVGRAFGATVSVRANSNGEQSFVAASAGLAIGLIR